MSEKPMYHYLKWILISLKTQGLWHKCHHICHAINIRTLEIMVGCEKKIIPKYLNDITATCPRLYILIALHKEVTVFLFKYDASRDQDIYSLRKAKEAVIKETDSLFKVLSFIKMWWFSGNNLDSFIQRFIASSKKDESEICDLQDSLNYLKKCLRVPQEAHAVNKSETRLKKRSPLTI